MQVIEPGVLYALSNFTGSEVQLLRFTVKRRTGKFDNGTTIEELFEVLLNKLENFEDRNSSIYNLNAIECIKAARLQMQLRLKSKLDTKYANFPDTGNERGL